MLFPCRSQTWSAYRWWFWSRRAGSRRDPCYLKYKNINLSSLTTTCTNLTNLIQNNSTVLNLFFIKLCKILFMYFSSLTTTCTNWTNGIQNNSKVLHLFSLIFLMFCYLKYKNIIIHLTSFTTTTCTVQTEHYKQFNHVMYIIRKLFADFLTWCAYCT